MSRYKEKLRRRRECAQAAKEPADEYSVIPDYAVRVYFRARAGLYGMTTKAYRSLKIEVSPLVYKTLARGKATKIRVPITAASAVCLGELYRDLRKGSANVSVFSVPFGGRMHAKALSAEETHSPRVLSPELTMRCFGFAADGRPLRKEWLLTGSVVQMAALQ